jgi:predicted nuclease of predicted toxin-antitoxin system
MKIIVDESVSYGLAAVLRTSGHIVTSIAESATSGIADEEIYNLAIQEQAILVTRDFHFSNPLRYPPQKTGGIIYVRHGNLKSSEEIEMVERFLTVHRYEEYSGRLVTLYKDSVKIR